MRKHIQKRRDSVPRPRFSGAKRVDALLNTDLNALPSCFQLLREAFARSMVHIRVIASTNEMSSFANS